MPDPVGAASPARAAPPSPRGLAALDPVAFAPGAPRLSVVVPTRERPDALAETLAALDAQDCDPRAVEVVVVDNAPSGATAAALAGRAGRLPLRAIVEAAPGPAAARNAGLAAARAPVVLFLGDDTRPAARDLLAAHLALHAADPRPAAAVLGRIAWRPDRPVTAFMHWLEHGGPQFDFDALAPGPVRPARSLYTPHVSLKVAALAHVGGFDARFPFAAVEDVELGLRLERAGLELVYHPELLVEHDHPYAPAGFGSRQERVGASARLMREIHGETGLLPAPRWSWPVHRALRPLLERLAPRPLPPRLAARVWSALALAGFADGWRKAGPLLEAARAPGRLPA
jgi:GT2 family glycosyltransferase